MAFNLSEPPLTLTHDYGRELPFEHKVLPVYIFTTLVNLCHHVIGQGRGDRYRRGVYYSHVIRDCLTPEGKVLVRSVVVEVFVKGLEST